MNDSRALKFQAAILSVVILMVLLGSWHLATSGGDASAAGGMTAEQIEYAMLMGKDLEVKKADGFPTLGQMGTSIWHHVSNPFYDNGPNDKGVGIQLAYSLGRVGMGFGLACLVAIPFGFVVGMSRLLRLALDPYIQVLKPISPLAWMPLALYTIKDSSISGVFVIFICSIWPMLTNTAFAVSSVKKEWLNVAATLEVNPLRTAWKVILPAAAPTILTGMRISMGIAWLVIVAAEMLVGGTGIGYFVWNEWNNLSLPSVIFAVLLIGVVGMLLDLTLREVQKMVTYVD